MHLSSMGVAVDPQSVESAAQAFDKLTLSIEKTIVAMHKLNGCAHGGIRVTSVGDLTEIIIEPLPSG